MWRIWRVYCGVTRGEMESRSFSRLHLHYTTLPHYPSTSLQWANFLEETCLIMFILVPHAMCFYLIWSYKGARNARPVQGNHQDFNDDKELLSSSNCSKPCNQISFYGTSDHDSFNNTASNSSHKSVGVKSAQCLLLYDNKNFKYIPKPPEFKWGSNNYHKKKLHQNIKEDVGRSCKRNGRLHMLLSYSVLQALGWGSVLAFSWTILKSHSLYHHNTQQCPTQYWSLQTEPNIIFDKEPYDQLLNIYENNDKAKDKKDLHSSCSKSYVHNTIFNPDIDRSLFSYLYSVASSQPLINSNVKDEGQISKRTGARKKSVCKQADSEIFTCEETDIPLYPSSNDIQNVCLSQKCEIPKIEASESALSTGKLKSAAKSTGNDESQSKFDTKNKIKNTKEIVTIEDCSESECESGISSAGSNDRKKNDSPKNRHEDAQKVIERELDAIQAIQKDMNGLLQRDLGLSLLDTDPEAAVLHFQAGAWLGDPDATYNLALCLHMGKGVKQNYKLARKYYSQASVAGHSWATYNLAVLVSSGLGGSVDNDLAYSLLQTAAERDVKQAKEAIRAMQEEDDYDEDLIDANHTGTIASGQ